jgi:hypothetical protein
MDYARKDLGVLVHNKGLRAEGHRRIIGIRDLIVESRPLSIFPRQLDSKPPRLLGDGSQFLHPKTTSISSCSVCDRRRETTMTMAPRERDMARGAHASVRETTTTMVASELGRRACAKGVVIAVLLIKIW